VDAAAGGSKWVLQNPCFGTTLLHPDMEHSSTLLWSLHRACATTQTQTNKACALLNRTAAQAALLHPLMEQDMALRSSQT
jgi:hypothetical protein